MATLADMGDEQFVSLTTYRRSGAAVATPVWIASAGDGALLVTTGDGSGKVKRIRHDPRVTLRPCSRRGHVANDAPSLTARAEVVDDPAEVERLRAPIVAKYGLQTKLISVARVLSGQRNAARVILRITAGSPTPDH